MKTDANTTKVKFISHKIKQMIEHAINMETKVGGSSTFTWRQGQEMYASTIIR